MAERVPAGVEALASLVAFGRELRARGLPVGTGRILTFLRAVVALGLTDRTSLYWAGRVSMIGRREDLRRLRRARSRTGTGRCGRRRS